MIHDQDRSGWFGASDTATIMGHWGTKTFHLWWLEKLGLRKNTYRNLAMQTGTAYEHRILEACGIKKMDRQIKIRALRLRVNLDGETRDRILEVKTHRNLFKVTKAYWMQAQVEWFAAGKPVTIVSYQLNPEDYRNWFNPIELCRLQYHPIEPDPKWINSAYLPRVTYLCSCLKKGVLPDESKIE